MSKPNKPRKVRMPAKVAADASRQRLANATIRYFNRLDPQAASEEDDFARQSASFVSHIDIDSARIGYFHFGQFPDAAPGISLLVHRRIRILSDAICL